MKKPPTKVTVSHEGTTYEVDVDDELRVDPQNLEESFLSQPGRYAWYATVHAAAQYLVDQKKLGVDFSKATVTARLRDMMDDKGKRRYTDTAIHTMMEGEPEVVSAVKALIEAKRQETVLRAVRESFVHRRDMLIQLGASERTEKQDSRL